jgi:hypothetical protein
MHYYGIALILEGNSYQQVQSILVILGNSQEVKSVYVALIRALIAVLQGKLQEASTNLKMVEEKPANA